ncbi:MAG: replication-associated recombination protein A [Deltaproteobacteria bacterium]|nr:MAG: replication-associated recombination protein A [Deltaproteobacteria bacterium]TDJ05941.1 MAG: replication-associated recombination protein A [Deltaproteobacteria bacterium]
MELFPRDAAAARTRAGADPGAPLAERMRPRDLDAFEGQQHLLGDGRPLAPIVQATGQLASLIFWGPPGSGKTTLARLLAERAQLRFVSFSAVTAGVRELRQEIQAAEEERRRGVRTALFIDEIHRFNKAQQDALLPHVERGVVALIGATTENPSFEVIPALRSRCRIFTLRPLSAGDLDHIVQRALHDQERGLGARKLEIDSDALELLTRLSQGDARRALTLLERAAEGAQHRIDRAAIESAVEARLPDYDKGGEAHYDVISAFIKSLRGSDPDAAVYWLARMLEGGEDPRFITRRMLIFASEDIGNADPQALPLASAAAEAFDRIGLPEGRLILAQAATYLASTRKSNASLKAINAATQSVEEHGALPVPLHLRNAPTELMRREGYGKGYDYPHDHPAHFVEAQYLPDTLRNARFYLPSEEGAEAELARLLRERWGTLKLDETER